MQLSDAASKGRPWMGLPTVARKALFVTCEEERNEAIFRADQIAQFQGKPNDRYDIVALEEEAFRNNMDSPYLAGQSRDGRVQPLPMLRALRDLVSRNGYDMISLDPLLLLFAGNHNDPVAVYGFVSMIRAMFCYDLGCTVILAGHPSLSGMARGDGSAGTTSWSNACRSRLYFQKYEQTNTRVLEIKKTNRAGEGQEIFMDWIAGYFVRVGDSRTRHDQDAAETFMKIMVKLQDQALRVSPYRSPTYAPAILENDADANGFTSDDFEKAMRRLLDQGLIKIIETGPASKRRSILLPSNDVPTPKYFP
jgi:RecA-family ATPase